jgi:peptidoglycan/xylan/chitin deacetylase (PgdA/CDA1 family)
MLRAVRHWQVGGDDSENGGVSKTLERVLVGAIILGVLGAACGTGYPPVSTTTTLSRGTSTNPPTSVAPSTCTTATPTTSLPPNTSLPPTSSTEVTPTPTTTSTATSTTAPSACPALIIRQGVTDQMELALTFDAGSDRGYAEGILDLLASRGVRASFSPTGSWTDRNQDLVIRMAVEGHTLINHTYDHPDMQTLDTTERLAQLARAEEMILGLTATSTKPYFRPPYGSCNADVLLDVGSAGYKYSVMWTVDSLGWKGFEPSAVAARVVDAAKPGAIVLMPVGSASTDYQALPAILDALDDAGYRYVTIAELVP